MKYFNQPIEKALPGSHFANASSGQGNMGSFFQQQDPEDIQQRLIDEGKLKVGQSLQDFFEKNWDPTKPQISTKPNIMKYIEQYFVQQLMHDSQGFISQQEEFWNELKRKY